jgi:cardiolipin synthase
MPHRKRHRRNLYKAYLSASRSGFVPGNQVTLLQNGEAYIPAIETAFDQARYEIYLETYIYKNDATGQRIAAALTRAALRGVKVYVLIDGYGSKDLPRCMLDRLQTDSVKTLIKYPHGRYGAGGCAACTEKLRW